MGVEIDQQVDAGGGGGAKPQAAGWRRAWRGLRIFLITLFVCWHLLMLFVSNTTLHTELTRKTLGRYERYTSMDQAWGMFSSPLFRTLPFPAVRITFSDGGSELVRSSNEPEDLTRFLRIGGARLRKLEHSFVTNRSSLRGDYREPIQRRLAESYLHRWRAAHPDDPRRPVKLTLIRRDFTIPQPGESWPAEPVATESDIAGFDLEGSR